MMQGNRIEIPDDCQAISITPGGKGEALEQNMMLHSQTTRGLVRSGKGWDLDVVEDKQLNTERGKGRAVVLI